MVLQCLIVASVQYVYAFFYWSEH